MTSRCWSSHEFPLRINGGSGGGSGGGDGTGWQTFPSDPQKLLVVLKNRRVIEFPFKLPVKGVEIQLAFLKSLKGTLGTLLHDAGIHIVVGQSMFLLKIICPLDW